MDKSILKGSILVALGACSYGVLTTFVKMAYAEGYTSHEVTFSQMALGLLGILLINVFFGKREKETPKTSGTRSKLKLIAAGTTLGLTSTFYYLAVKYIPVSIGIVMLDAECMDGSSSGGIFVRKKDRDQKRFWRLLAILARYCIGNQCP